MEVKLLLNSIEYKDLTSYCNLNDLLISDVVKKSFSKGFNIERYGLLNANQDDNKTETVVEKIVEVIKEVPIEKVVEVVKEVTVEKIVEVIKEVPVEKIVEVVKEVFVEKIVEVIKEVPVEKVVEVIKEVHTPQNEVKVVEYVDREVIVEKVIGDDTKQKMLEQTLHNVRVDILSKDKKIKELEDMISSFQKYQQNTGAAYLRGSNLDNTMFK